MLRKDFPNNDSNLRLIAAVIALGLLLIFLLWRASTGELILPGRVAGPEIVLRGIAIWVACLLPVLWLVAEVILNSYWINLSSKARKILYVVFMAAGTIAAIGCIFL